MEKASPPQVYADFPIDQLDEVRPALSLSLIRCAQLTPPAQVHESTTRAHLERRCQPYEYRMHYLKQLGYMIQDNIPAICQSVKEDLGRRPEETEFGEVSIGQRML